MQIIIDSIASYIHLIHNMPTLHFLVTSLSPCFLSKTLTYPC